MYKNSIKDKIRIHLSNSIGWSTKRKIVVLESDDWGSIRTANSLAYEQMNAFGLNVSRNHYGYDSLESNQDLETLLNVLLEFKDATGRPPVFTPFCNMANPDFESIEAANFEAYQNESLEQTILKYPAHTNLLDYWRLGEKERLFCPQLHGREHIHIGRWWEILKSGDQGMLQAFKLRSVGATAFNGAKYPNYAGALHPIKSDEIPGLHQILEDAGKLYKQYLGHLPEAFVAPNAEEPAELAGTLKQIGIKTITRAKIRTYPLGDGEFKKEFNWPGKINQHEQTILVRNAFFEPVSFGEPDKAYIKDWVENCLKEIEIAFKWKKPAVVSTHRVNYIGFINNENQNKGISALRRLLKEILNKWPDVEFMTSAELGLLINNNNKS